MNPCGNGSRLGKGQKEWTPGNGAWHGVCKMAADPHVSTGIRRNKGLMIREIGSSERVFDQNGLCILKG
jgi:hypothetical protein